LSMRLAVEPAAALPLAALQGGAWPLRAADRVCLVVCGANVDPTSLA
jgi:threonine dehydratase